MSSRNVRDSLQDGIDLQSPPVGPDGTPQLPPVRPDIPPRPRLCEAGPCKHYHRFDIELDVEQPKTGARVSHVQAHHYCYPAPGVDTELGSLPVVQCNRWVPMLDRDHRDAKLHNLKFQASPDGRHFEAKRDAWRDARAAELEAEGEAARLIAESLTEGDHTP